jgi:hypothetical protein
MYSSHRLVHRKYHHTVMVFCINYHLPSGFLINRCYTKKRRTCFIVSHCEVSVHVYVFVYERRNLFGIYVYYLLGKKHNFEVYINAMKCSVLHSSSPTISTVQAMYKMHVSIVYTCKYNTSAQQSQLDHPKTTTRLRIVWLEVYQFTAVGLNSNNIASSVFQVISRAEVCV